MKIALCGIGRAGQELIRTLSEEEDCKIVTAFCRTGSGRAGKDIGLLANMRELNICAIDIVHADIIMGIYRPDAVIDFSSPSATKFLLAACQKHGIPAVVCTTGFTAEDIAWMKDCTINGDFGIVYAPNVTVGINVLLAMLKAAAQGLPYYDYHITELHHNKKTDAPSGTARKIASLLEKELHMSPDEHVPINSVRAGGYVGVHEVLAVGEYDRITIVHESFSRRAFAKGAIEAARFIQHRTGWYEMEDVIAGREEIIKVKV